ncbi:MAG: hypothetical protein CM1200mP41_14140 [Gammaproteobacteria bacterium]|nr:MAG: hypothetical protein CM1200mP41_14140 [Gammaproteobacteria bacterium]
MALGLANDVGMPVPVGGFGPGRFTKGAGRVWVLGRKDFSVMWEEMAKAAGLHQSTGIDDGAS